MNFCSTSQVATHVTRSLAAIGASGYVPNPNAAADQPLPVQLRAPHRAASVSANGLVEASVNALMAFQVGGRVARVYAEDEQFVMQGHVHVADLTSHLQADERMRGFYTQPGAWGPKAILNVAESRRVSSDLAMP